MMRCEKCQLAAMEARKVFRLSGCLAVIGFLLLIPSFLLLCAAVLTGVVGAASASKAGAQVMEGNQQKALAELRTMDGLPEGIIADFERSGRVDTVSLESLTVEQSNAVARVERRYRTVREAQSTALGTIAFFGGSMVLMLLALGVPGLLVGLLLTMRKKVWKCPACGYIFDRA